MTATRNLLHRSIFTSGLTHILSTKNKLLHRSQEDALTTKEMLEVPWIAINPQIQEGGGGGEKDKKRSYFLHFSKKSSLGSI